MSKMEGIYGNSVQLRCQHPKYLIRYSQKPLVLEDEIRSSLKPLPSWKDAAIAEICLAAEEESVKVLTNYASKSGE